MVLQCSPTLSQERLCCLSNCSTNAKIACHVCNISMSGKLFCAPALQTLFPPLRQLANQAVGVVTKPSGIPRCLRGASIHHLHIESYLQTNSRATIPRESSRWSAPTRDELSRIEVGPPLKHITSRKFHVAKGIKRRVLVPCLSGLLRGTTQVDPTGTPTFV